MSIRPANKEKTKWEIDYYPMGRKGKRIRETFQGNEADAREYEIQQRRGNVSIISVNPKIMDMLPEWFAFYQNNRLPNTYRDAKNCMKVLIPFFGKYQSSRLAPVLVEQYKTKRLEDGVCKITVNKELSYFSSLLTWAVDNNHANPLPFKIKKFPRVKSPKPHVLHPQEVEALINAIEPLYRPIALLLYDAGFRRAEALGLKAEDVNLSNKAIMIKGKGGKEEVVPIMTERLYQALSLAKKQNPHGFLFANQHTGKPFYGIRKALQRAAKKAGIEQRIYHHLLRHSFGTHALRAGINLRALQGLMRHSTSKVTELYAHLGGDYLQEEGAKFGDYIRRIKQTTKQAHKRLSK